MSSKQNKFQGQKLHPPYASGVESNRCAHFIGFCSSPFRVEASLKKRGRKNKPPFREIKLRLSIADHDYQVKKRHVQRFLEKGRKVKITVMFRGREQEHPQRGRILLQRLVDDLGDQARAMHPPQHRGRDMTLMVEPCSRKDA